eukprot:tig00020510_g9837.t1
MQPPAAGPDDPVPRTPQPPLKRTFQECGAELEEYAECVVANADSWDSACAREKRATMRCAEQFLSGVGRLRAECAAQTALYEQCLKQNGMQPTKCEASFAALWNCARVILRAPPAGAGDGDGPAPVHPSSGPFRPTPALAAPHADAHAGASRDHSSERGAAASP